MEAGPRKISEIFNTGRELSIPFFQRGYVWEKEDWERFLDSMVDISETENKKSNFFGSIILKRLNVSSDKIIGDCFSVIDGQQRLTTFCLFFKALYKVQNNPDGFYKTFFNRVHESILKHNCMDREIFNAIIDDKLTPELEHKYAKNNVLQAYKYFIEHEDNLKNINDYDILNYVQFVGIDLGENEDEQQIFDTINSLGVRLTTAELLKNHLYPSVKDEVLFNSTWHERFEKDEDERNFWDADITTGREKRNNLDVLLQSYFIILKKSSNKFKLKNLFQEYKTYLTENGITSDMGKKENFVSDLIRYADLYKKHIDITLLDKDSETEIKTQLQRLIVAIFSLDITTMIPYILYVLKNVSSEVEQNNIFKLLETYVVRCAICRISFQSFNRLFSAIVNNEIKTATELKDYLINRDAEIKMPSDLEVKDSFACERKTLYVPKSILYLLELAVRNADRQNTKLLSIKNYDLEHIMPQNWEKNWPLPTNTDKSEDVLEDERNKKVASIGNMTILKNGLNKSLKNKSWTDKKYGKNQDGLVKYGAGLETFSQYIDLPAWDENTIDKRAEFLLQKALEVWKI